MRTLYFEINGQTLRKIDNFSGIIKGSKQYLKCHFTVKDPEWIGIGMVAVFENGDLNIRANNIHMLNINNNDVPNVYVDNNS